MNKPESIKPEIKKIPFDSDKFEYAFGERGEKKVAELLSKNYVVLERLPVTSWLVFLDNGSIRRDVDELMVLAPANMEIPEKIKEGLLEKMFEAAREFEYFVNDLDAIQNAYESIEAAMQQYSVDVQYKKRGCPKCVGRMLRSLANSIGQVNDFFDTLRDLCLETHGDLPKILPPLSDMKNWEVRDHKFVRKEPLFRAVEIHPTPQHIQAIHKILQDIEKEQLAKKDGGKCQCKKDGKKECTCKKGECKCHKKEDDRFDFSSKKLSGKGTIADIKATLTKEINNAGANGDYTYLLKDAASAANFKKKIREATGIKNLSYKLVIKDGRPHFTFGLAKK